MRTRNGDSSKAAAAKKTPPARKSASKSPANAKSPQTPRTSTIRTRQGKKNEVSPLQNSSLDEKPEQSSEKTKAAVSASQVTPDTKVATPAKSTPKRTPGRPRKTVSTQKQGEQVVAIADETPKGDDFAVVEKAEEPQNVERVEANENECEKVGKQDGCVVQSAGHERQPMEVDESVVANASELLEKERDIVKVEVSATQDAPSLNQEEPLEVELTKSSVNEYFTSPKEGEQEKKEHVEKASEKSIEEETNCIGCIEQSNTDYISMEVTEHGEQTKEEDGEKALEKSMKEDGDKGLEKSMKEDGEKVLEKSMKEDGEKGLEKSMEEDGEKGLEKSMEEDGEKGLEKSMEGDGEKGLEKSMEEDGEKGLEKSMEEDREKGLVKSMEEDGEKGLEKSMEEDGEKGLVKSMEEDGEKGLGRSMEEDGEKGLGRSMEEDGEKGLGRSMEEDGEKGLGKSMDEDGEKGLGRSMEEDGEKGLGRSMEEDGEKGLGKSMDEDGEKGLGKSMEEDGGKGLEKSMEEEANNITGKEESNTDSVEMEVKHQYRQDDVKPEKDNLNDNQGTRGSGEKLDLGEQREEFVEDDPEEPHEETETLDEEGRELTAIAKERKIKKEHEIFVGGLDRDATEEDLKKVFEKIGEVVDVRLHKNSSTNKNKGYAFVKFSCQEHAKKALSEMKNPVIRGKRCGTAPSEDNDTLFLGNICNTWTKEAIKQKLKDYGVEGVESITLVPDVQHEGLSRGFAFLEFSCHADAMLAYKRLQKPDVIFGHAERTAKVAFAEPVREPDPEVMAQVKSVFIDGLPPHWDEDCIREHFKGYGEIVRIVLARNMSSAKRKDFGFVDFSSHEGAVTCVDGVNSSEFVDGASKTKVRARLSNPLPKTQAVKGSMCGGFRIGHARTGAYTRSGRGFTRGGQTSNLGNFNKDRNFNHGGRGQIGRTGFQNDLDHNNMHPDFHRRQFGFRGERMGPLRGGHYAGGQGAAIAGPSRPYLDRAWYGTPKRGPAEAIPPRMPFSPEGQFDRPLMGRHFDDPYLYDDNRHGVKRPFYMTDPDPNYLGPVRFRPRLDYTDPAVFHGSRHHDSIGTGSGQYSRDYYGSDYGGGPYSSFYGGDNPYGRGFHY